MNRRDFIKGSASKAFALYAGASLFLKACHTEEDMIGEPNWIVEGGFDRPLPIPQVANGNASLIASVSSHGVLKSGSASTYSYGEGILGSTIKTTKGQTVNVQLQNNLDEETNIHWHGLIVPENMDGHPKDVASAGGTLNYAFPIIQRAGTYWYHPHPHGQTAKQVFMGLAGMFIVNDDEEAALNLPSGDYEVPLIIQDKHFAGSSLEYSPNDEEIMSGYLGEQIIVNGIHSPFASVATRWYRLRILNGSTARVYNFGFSNGLEFYIIGSDGGLFAQPEKTSAIMLGPGERVDILVDFSAVGLNKEIFLLSHSFTKYEVNGRQGFKIMKFKVDRSEADSFSLPQVLSSVVQIPTTQSVKTRTFDISKMVGGSEGAGHSAMGRHSINGRIFEMDRVDETVEAGATEIWEFDNLDGDEIHPMHIHGAQFQVLERIGGRNKIIASEKGWKDTVLLMPGEKVSVIMTFPQYTGKFVMHCHNLEHEDDGMMMNFEIV